MRTLFHPFLPNGPEGDPVVWVDLLDEGSSVLLDLGDVRHIHNRKLLRVDRVVVTHTHMDHFVGFDQLLRVSLGREKELVITGPAGFIGRVQGKLDAYTWNLIEDYPVRLLVEEVDGETIRSAVFSGRNGLVAEALPDRPFNGPIHDHRAYTIHADILDHGIPVLGVALRETEHLSVNRDRLERLGLVAGPWLSELKQSVRRCRPEDEELRAETVAGGERTFRCGELSAEILFRTPGHRMAYLADMRYTPQNCDKAIDLARDADLMICEAAFLHRDESLARERFHLTARQAGELARAAGAQKLAPFHFSPRYQGVEQELLDEAAAAFGGPVIRLPRML